MLQRPIRAGCDCGRDADPMTVEVTREELYRQVWARPVMQVAADYGVSNVALKKICRKHGIPVPARGHWQRKTAGKKVGRAPRLGASEAGESVVIRGSRLPDLPPAVRDIQLRARDRERRPENLVEVPAAPAELHPAVAATWDALDQVEPNEIGLVAVARPGIFNIDVAREQIPRAMVFLNALVTAAEQRGCSLGQGEDALAFVVDGQAVDIKLLELVDRVPHLPTEGEELAVRKWDSLHRMFSGAKHLDAVMPQPEIPEFDFALSGRLQVILNERHPGLCGLRRVFGDGESRPIEKLINPVLVALQAWSAATQVQHSHVSCPTDCGHRTVAS